MKKNKLLKFTAAMRIVLSWLCFFSLIALYLGVNGMPFSDIFVMGFCFMLLCLLYMVFRKAKLDDPKRKNVVSLGCFMFNVISICAAAFMKNESVYLSEILYFLILLMGYLTNDYLASYLDTVEGLSNRDAKNYRLAFGKQNKIFFTWLGALFGVTFVLAIFPYSSIGQWFFNWLKKIGKAVKPAPNTGKVTVTPTPTPVPESVNYVPVNAPGAVSRYHNLAMLIMTVIAIGIIIFLIRQKLVVKEDEPVEEVLPEVKLPAVIESVTDIEKIRKKKCEMLFFSGNPSKRIRRYFIASVKNVNPSITKNQTPKELIKENMSESTDRADLRNLYEKARYSGTMPTPTEADEAKKHYGAIQKKT